MAAWKLHLFFSDGINQLVVTADSPKITEDKVYEIFNNGWSYKSGDITYYYPASSILKAEVTHYE